MCQSKIFFTLISKRINMKRINFYHYYDYDNIDGYEHITMEPTGESFHHDGSGNVDHFMWVTMTEDGPEMGNIALKGLFDRKGIDPSLFGAYDRKGHPEQKK